MMTAAQFCHELAHLVPALRPVLDEHVAFYEELLPCVFLFDVVEHLYALGCRGDDDAWREVDAIFGFAEQGWANGDELTKDVLSTCLLEGFQDFEQRCPVVVDHLGPALREEFRKICPWVPRKPKRGRRR